MANLNLVLRNSFSKIKEDMATTRSLQSMQKQRIDELRADLAYIKEKSVTVDRINLIKIKLGEISSQIAELADKKPDMGRLQEEFVAARAYDNAVQGIDRRIAGIEKELSGFLREKQLKRFGEEVIKKIKTIESQLKDIKDTHKKLSELDRKVVHLAYFEKQIAEMTSIITSVKEDVRQLQDKSLDKQDYARFALELKKRIEKLERHAVTKQQLTEHIRKGNAKPKGKSR